MTVAEGRVVAVTGASGFLGGHVLRLLAERGVMVKGFDISGTDDGPGGIQRLDLLEPIEVLTGFAGVTDVVHCGGVPRPGGSAGERLFETNLMSTFNVAEAAASQGVSTLVYASSYSVLGPPFNGRPVHFDSFPLTESTPVGAQEPYALSKALGEFIFDSSVRAGRLSKVMSLRFPWIQSSKTFDRDIAPLQMSIHESARHLWAYIDCDDAARAVLAALESEVSGHRRYLLSADDTFMDIPTDSLLDEAYPGVPRARRFDKHESVLSAAKARAELGFSPAVSWRDY